MSKYGRDGQRLSQKRRRGAGSLYRRADQAGGRVRWVVSWPLGDGRRGSKSFQSEEAAREWIAKEKPDLLARESWQHGSSEAYTMYGCRCDACKAGDRERRAARGAKKAAAGEVEHGTKHAYSNLGCRCAACSASYVQWNAASRSSAHRQRQQWTMPELQHALERGDNGRYMRTAEQVASDIGRTIFAVQAVRLAENDPRKGGMV